MKLLLVSILALSFSSHSFAATYEVPVTESLKEFAKFDLVNFKKRIDGDKMTIKYNLPSLLTGSVQKIRLEGNIVNPTEEFIMIGDNAVAICTGPYSTATCKVEYNNLTIDAEKAIQAIRQVSKSEAEVGARIEVMKSFSTDPVGIITY